MGTTTSKTTLGGAIVSTAILAGIYTGFAVAVMPGLRDADDRTFVTTMQTINDAIVNPAFMTVFLGGPALTAAVAWREVRRGGLASRRAQLVLAAVALHLAGLGLTAGANVPLNDALANAGDPVTMRAPLLAEARAAYEQPWTRRHLLRTGVTIAALGCLTAAGLAGEGATRRRRTAGAHAGAAAERSAAPSRSARAAAAR
ncbi:MAG: DUF1772 domain-containing protein [Patulibacter minatonensis]